VLANTVMHRRQEERISPENKEWAKSIEPYAMYESRYSRNELMKMMDCFKTLIFMEHYRVKEIYECSGWEEGQKNLTYHKIYGRDYK